MNGPSAGRNVVRALVSLFVAGSVVSFFRLQGLTMWAVFIVVYLGVSQLFFNSAEKLEQDHSRLDQEPESDEPQPPIRIWEQPIEEKVIEVSPSLREDFIQSIQALTPNLEGAEFNGETQFQPIHEDEETQPHYDPSSNRIFISKELFEEWLVVLGEEYHVSIPPEMVNEWVMNQNLVEISTWINEHRPS